jgi:hypothetical protein
MKPHAKLDVDLENGSSAVTGQSTRQLTSLIGRHFYLSLVTRES